MAKEEKKEEQEDMVMVVEVLLIVLLRLWVIYCFLVRFTDEKINWLRTQGRTDARKDGPNDRRTHPLLEMRGRI